MHEFAHWRRRDFWWVQFGRFMLALLWWNPLLRLALARMNAEAEEAADDMVVLDGRRGEAYAQALVEIAAGDPRGGSGIGVSMLGYRSLERRIRRVLQDNEWRGKLGRLAIAALVATGLIFAGVSSVYMAMAAPENATPSVKNSLLTGEMRTVAERVVANTKRRLEALRHTHAKMESQLSIEQDGKLTMAPDVSRIEAWNDLWTNLHKVEYRPQVSRWIDGGAPFFVQDQNDICDGKKAYYFNPDDIADVERYAAGPRAMFVDYLSVQPSKDVIRILESMLNMNTVPESMTYSFGYVDWKGRRALQIQEVYTRDGARIQIRTLVIRPDANDLVSLSEIRFPRKQRERVGEPLGSG